MNRPLRSLLGRHGGAWRCGAALACILLASCANEQKKPPPQPKYPTLPKKEVPTFMSGTIWEKVDVGNTEPFQISGYGLVVNLDNTGDSTAPTAVRQYMIKEMLKHGFGSKLDPTWAQMPPERLLKDKSVAIVQVVGMLPPGVRKGQQFDVYVQCLPRNTTSSLAGGKLYLTELKINGADPEDPFSKINVYAQSKGPVFVNPAYALNRDVRPASAIRQSLRRGVIMDGGVATYDRPLFLQLRMPERRLARNMEQRIIDRFQDTTVAAAEDEGIVQIFVPPIYRGDWVHFAKLVTHLYLNVTPDAPPALLAGKAKMLAAEAQKPGAALEDISYCWEGIGPAALPFIAPLLSDKRPEVAFAAARAAACIGDVSGSAVAALSDMARTPSHPFQINAVQALGGLPPSAAVNQVLRQLLDTDKTLVRVEAYKVLARNRDPFITTRVVTENPTNQKFFLDVVPSHGPPIIYATRTGDARIAIIGDMPEISTPVMFSAMGQRLTISSPDVGRSLTIFYRAAANSDADGTVHEMRMPDPVNMLSNPDVAELIERLGGIVNSGEKPLDFTYSEIVAILQGLNEQKKLVAYQNGVAAPAAFMLQDPPSMQKTLYSAPSIDTGRPQQESAAPSVSSKDPAAEAALAGGR